MRIQNAVKLGFVFEPKHISPVSAAMTLSAQIRLGVLGYTRVLWSSLPSSTHHNLLNASGFLGCY